MLPGVINPEYDAPAIVLAYYKGMRQRGAGARTHERRISAVHRAIDVHVGAEVRRGRRPPERFRVSSMSPEFTTRSALVSPTRRLIGTVISFVLVPLLTPDKVMVSRLRIGNTSKM